MSAPKQTAGYERSDARARPLVVAGVALVVLMALAMVASRALFDAFERGDAARGETHPMAAQRRRAPGPVLQADPTIEPARQRAWEEATLSTYGWVDPVGGVVRVPVERAVELVLAEGLPVRPDVPEEER